MRSFYYILLLALLISPNLKGQSHQVVSSGGGQFDNGNISMDFTLGEPVISTFNSGGYILTQGFHQPDTNSLPSQNGGRLLVRAFLQGAYKGTASMDTALKASGYLPLSQPYTGSPWFYGGNEQLSAIPPRMVDWVLVEVRSSPDTIVARRAALLRDNGMIYDTGLNQGILFDSLAPGGYYIVIDHRNHMPVMTAVKHAVPAASVRDLGNTASYPAYGGNTATADLGGGIRGLISGDINKDGILKYSGPSNDRTLILQRITTETGSTSIQTTVNGYFAEDLSMNGNIKYSGPGNDPSRIIQNLVNITGSTAINSTLVSPVPAGVLKN
ncbi:MAG: hypothetical protein IH599_03870 [Bacteroidales bacterium]|nr:hypothetical protein [Bacteroidales bacterium]